MNRCKNALSFQPRRMSVISDRRAMISGSIKAFQLVSLQIHRRNSLFLWLLFLGLYLTGNGAGRAKTGEVELKRGKEFHAKAVTSMDARQAEFARRFLRSAVDAMEEHRAVKLTSKLKRNLAEGYRLLGQTLRMLGKKKRSLASFRASLALQNWQPQLLWELASLEEETGEWEAAAETMRQLIAFDPSSSRAWRGLGWVSFKCGWHLKAVEAFTSAVRLSQRDPQIYYNLGRAAELYGPGDDVHFWAKTVQPNMTLAKALSVAVFRQWICSQRQRDALMAGDCANPDREGVVLSGWPDISQRLNSSRTIVSVEVLHEGGAVHGQQRQTGRLCNESLDSDSDGARRQTPEEGGGDSGRGMGVEEKHEGRVGRVAYRWGCDQQYVERDVVHVVLRDVFLAGNDAAIFDVNGMVYAAFHDEQLPYHANLPSPHPSSSGCPLPIQDAEQLGGDSVLLVFPFGPGFYHWLLDAMPRLLLALQRVPATARLIVPSDGESGHLHRFMGMLIHMAGVPRARLYHYPVRAYSQGTAQCVRVRCETLHLVDWRRREEDLRQDTRHFPPRFALQLLRSSLIPAPHRTRPATAVVYVQRSKAEDRRVKDERSLIARMRKIVHEESTGRPNLKAPFIVFADDPSPPMHEAVRVFRKARISIGMHGAGLANAVFSPAGQLCCLPRNCYAHLAMAMGFCYWQVAVHDGGAHGRLYSSVDTTAVLSTLTQILQSADTHCPA